MPGAAGLAERVVRAELFQWEARPFVAVATARNNIDVWALADSAKRKSFPAGNYVSSLWAQEQVVVYGTIGGVLCGRDIEAQAALLFRIQVWGANFLLG